jgi:glycosyltransferase involved in cell wall biosynthesis
MRILYFTRDYTPHDHRFLAALAQTEHQVAMLRLERRGPQREDRPIPAKIEQVPWRGGLTPARWQDGPALLSDLKRVLRQFHPDLVHAGTIQTSAFLTALAGFRPLVSMSWGSDLLRDADRSRAWQWATTFTLKRSRVLVGDCQAVRQKAVQLGFPTERIVTFPWGVDLQEFSPAQESDLRARLGWQDAFVLLSLRSWEPLYGVDVMVRAFITAAHEQPELRLFLLGTGSQAGQIRQMVEQSGVGDRVHFEGQVSHANLVRFYRASDLYVSASYSDGSSVSLMEALACGLPVLVSDIPSNREWITPGVQGWLFPDGDSGALAQKILGACAQRDPQLWGAKRDPLAEIGKASRALAEQRADWQKNFKQLLAAYELAMQPRRPV